jgi:H/ACA ribonucleoprotein complex non-core subunit NAF1
MVGFISKPSIDDLDQAPRLKNSSNSLDSFDTKSAEFPFSDSFLDFDSIKDWFEDITIPDMDDIGKVEYGATEKPTELGQDQIPHESKQIGNASKLNVDGSEPVVRGCEPNVGRSGCAVKVEEGECEKLRNLSCCIEQEMGKVTLVAESLNSGIGNENDVKSEIESDGDESGSSESESESSSSSTAASSSGSSDDDDEKEEEKKEVEVEVKRSTHEGGEVEEGEIRDVDEQEMVGGTNDDDGEEEEENNEDDGEVMVGWSDVDEDGDEDEGGAAKGPIRSANELEVSKCHI